MFGFQFDRLMARASNESTVTTARNKNEVGGEEYGVNAWHEI